MQVLVDFVYFFYSKGDKLSRLLSAKIIIFDTFKWVFLNMIELISYENLNFWGTTKNNSWLPHVQQEIFKRDLQLHVFLHILKEKKHDDLFSKSKKSLLRNTKSNKLYNLGMQWIARLAFVRRVNRCAIVIACLLLTGLCTAWFSISWCFFLW